MSWDCQCGGQCFAKLLDTLKGKRVRSLKLTNNQQTKPGFIVNNDFFYWVEILGKF